MNKKKAVTIVVKNNTTSLQPIQLWLPPNDFSGINATTHYKWNITGQSFSGLANVSIIYVQNGITTPVTAPILQQSLEGVLNALNGLNVGRFWATTEFGQTYINTFNDFIIYENLIITGGMPLPDMQINIIVGAGATVFFNLSMISPFNSHWEWGDSTSTDYNAAFSIVSHTFTLAGSYTISVSFTNSASLQGFDSFSSSVQSINLLTSNFPGLQTFSINNSSMTSFNAANLTNSTTLATLNLSINQLTTFNPSPLALGIAALYLNDNAIATINPASFNSVGAIQLDNNFITSFDISQLIMPANGQFTISNNGLTTLVNASGISPNMINFTAQTNHIPASQINAVLIALDTAGLSNGTLLLNNQTPTAPPSGAGITAKNNLIAKSWAVLTD